MIESLSRRSFIGGAVAGSLFSVFKSTNAEASSLAGITSIIASGTPLVLVSAVADAAYELYSDQKQEDTLDQIASQLVSISNRQASILEELSNQRLVIREEMKRAQAQEAIRSLIVASQRFKFALAGRGHERQAALAQVGSVIDDVAPRLGTYGLIAAPAYVAAIGLQNAVHIAMRSSRGMLKAINQVHKENLTALLSGNDPEDLPAVIKKNPRKTIPGADKSLYDFGERSEVYSIVKYDPKKNQYYGTQHGYSYEGIQAGKVLLKPYVEPLNDAQLNDWYSLPKLMAMTGARFKQTTDAIAIKDNNTWLVHIVKTTGDVWNHKPVSPMYTGDMITRDASGKPALTPKHQKDIAYQTSLISVFYKSFYKPSMGDITPESIYPLTETQKNLTALLRNGVGAVDRIIGGRAAPHLSQLAEPHLAIG